MTVFFPTNYTLTKMDRWLKARGLRFTGVEMRLEPTELYPNSLYVWQHNWQAWAVHAF